MSDYAAHGGDEKVNILVVDDLPEKLLAFEMVLEELGENLVLANSGAEALRELLQREFAVIVLDVNMPDIDGIETADLIRQHPKTAHTPIIFVTAYADEMQTARGYALGAVDYILAPVVPEILRSKVKVFVDLFRAQRRAQALARAEADRAAAEEATRRSQFLAQANHRLTASLDLGKATQELLAILVPSLADVALLWLTAGPDDDAQPVLCWRRRAEADTIEENGVGTAAPLEQRQLPPRLLQAMTATRTRGTRRTVRFSGGRDANCVWPADLRDAVVLPLVAGDAALGTVALGGVQLPAGATEPDYPLLDELASRAAIAFENARLYRNLQREMERARAAEEKLQEASRRKDEFLAMLSHELRNPLAPIRNATEVMRVVAPSDPAIIWAREVVERQVTHMAQLVEDLLDVSRITQGKIVLKKAPVELSQLIKNCAEAVRPHVESRRQKLTVATPASPIWVFGDAERLAQVVGNLLHNAVKYSAENGAIAVSAAADQGEAIVTVHDDGIGIEPELLPHVFELFMQGNRSLDRSQGGLGIGLTVVQRLIELHGGRVSAASEGVDRGAQFTITLPCISEVPAASVEPLAAVREAGAQGLRVLVVDDNIDAAETIAVYLRLEGHDVRTVHDGGHAVGTLDSFTPEVAVVDIGLPGMNGYEVARRLREHPATTTALLIALTGYGQSEDRARSAAVGFDYHFVKPADPHAIQETITAWHRRVDAQAVSRHNEAL